MSTQGCLCCGVEATPGSQQQHYSLKGLPKCMSRAPSQYPKRRLSVRSRKVSKPRDLYLELSDRSEIWQALRQQCCRCACQISKRYDNLKNRSCGFETLRDLTERRLFGYWDGAQGVYLHTLTLHVSWFVCLHHTVRFINVCNFDDSIVMYVMKLKWL